MDTNDLDDVLVKFSEEKTNSLHIPQKSKDFFINVGVARARRSCFPITHVDTGFPKLSEICLPFMNIPDERDYHVYAHFALDDYPPTSIPISCGYHCLSEPSGNVILYARDRRREYRYVFCSSSIQQFFELLHIIEEYEHWLFDYIDNHD